MSIARKPRLSLIAAVADNGIIGSNNALPWRLPEDLKRFRTLTMGHPVIMGRKTHESIGRPLPGRRNIVVTRNRGFRAEGCEVAESLQAAIAACGPGCEEAFIIGGAQIYKEALPMARRAYLTEIRRSFEGDARFPDLDRLEWKETAREAHVSSEGLAFDFAVYDREDDG